MLNFGSLLQKYAKITLVKTNIAPKNGGFR